MSLKIKVDPIAVKDLTENARIVPNERIDAALNKLEELETTLSTWKGNGKDEYDDVHANVKKTLINTQQLMTAMLSALDNAVDEFTYMDKDISERFKSIVDNHTSK